MVADLHRLGLLGEEGASRSGGSTVDRRARVAALRHLIETGGYFVDLEQLAQRLVGAGVLDSPPPPALSLLSPRGLGGVPN